jgi:hypothetical protein
MTTETMRRMTADEMTLLIRLRRWLGNIGAIRTTWGDGMRLPDGRQLEWRTEMAPHWPRYAEIGVHPDRRSPLRWTEVESVTQAVDIWVALGYLPVRFSSEYRAGWNAAREHEACGWDGGTPKSEAPVLELTW